jgi:3-oxoacyl-[acyl-carrier protein] reductase
MIGAMLVKLGSLSPKWGAGTRENEWRCCIVATRTMDSLLRGMTVLVTGASGGIGTAIAESFAAEGANLVLHGRRAPTALSTPHTIVGGDVRHDCAAIIDAGVRAFGRVDVCIANAGIWPPEALPIHELPEARMREVIETNLLGAMFTARAFLRALAKTGPREDGRGASLIFIGSTAGRFGEAGHAEYAASKSALRGLTLSLKNEIVALDPRGRVNLVEPGWTLTPMAREALDDATVERVLATRPLQQIAEPIDIARAVVFLASPLAAHITGEVMTISGGMEGRLLSGFRRMPD